ncbi:MAG: FtsX-like permease family protein [Alphaproteobacteria bacterium]|nr:FtsX-like permease family protein [Alphaproteobacteria bacterium]
MSALDRKVLRDLARLWAQGLAIAMVLAAGVATLVLGIGAQNSLSETRAAYYERYRFADVFAGAKRAPEEVADRLAAIPGVAAVHTRIKEVALLDIPDQSEPATGVFLSLPVTGRPRLNDFYLLSGRLPDPDSRHEVLANETFAKEHGFQAGATFAAILNGKKRDLVITGVMMLPEYIYALGPGDLVPDGRRFGVFAMPYKALAGAFDLDGAFNDVAVDVLRGTTEAAVIDAVDEILAPYGGVGAYDREDHQSNAFIDAELVQLRSMSFVIPPIFLAIAAFLVNITIARLIALEREQIGLMKAIGYSTWAVGFHYMKLVMLIALVGVVIGWGAGWWLGRGLTRLYGDFFNFPFLIFTMRPDIYMIAAGAGLAAAVVGAVNAISGVVRLPPAVAMSPPAPPRYRKLFTERLGLLKRAPMALTMALRNITRWPIRASLTTLGLALSIATLVGAMFAEASVDLMLEATFFGAERQDATLTFTEITPIRAVEAARQLPGVLRVEPFRTVPIRLSKGHLSERTSLSGKPLNGDLSRVIDFDLNPISLPDQGIAMSDMLADLIDARRGDLVTVEILAGRRETHEVRVTAIVQDFFGLSAYANIATLNTLLRDGNAVDGVHIAFDANDREDLFARVKEIPAIAAIALQGRSLKLFRDIVERNILTMMWVYTLLAVVIAFGVVYNSVRIQLSERARELASLRVLGFTRAEVSFILLGELTLLCLVAIPLGWVLGFGMAWIVIQGLQSELYRVPLIVNRDTYGYATAVFVTVAVVSALVVRNRIDHLDLIAVLKTRD